VSRPEEVVEALRTGNIVVIRNHGIVSMGRTLADAFYLVEELEEAVRTAAFARLLGGEKPAGLGSGPREAHDRTGEAHPMFSEEHILAIVDLINQDAEFLAKAAELGLTTRVAIKLDEEGTTHRFNFVNGDITGIEQSDDAPFVISGPRDVWKLIFEGKLDPFVATTQGKLKLDGDMAKLSRWYVPFTRMFTWFKRVRIE
jgi:putative sterol carrier protein